MSPAEQATLPVGQISPTQEFGATAAPLRHVSKLFQFSSQFCPPTQFTLSEDKGESGALVFGDVSNVRPSPAIRKECESILMKAIARPTRQLVRMRGRSYVAFVFCPAVPIVAWLEEIDATLGHSPGFFIGKPVVLDLSAVDLSQTAIVHLVTSLEQRNIRVLGIEGVDGARLTSSMPPLLTGGRHCVLTQNEPKKPETKPKPMSLLLESPVRSGQSVFTEGDVTILGSVSSGAEIVAGGSIHIYGTLRGRAMAGANGNSAARIYCQKIEAELLAIDGHYQTAEEIDAALCNQPAQVRLEGNIMKITPLN